MIRALFFLLFSAIASGQQYVLSTFAGGVPPLTPVDAPAVSIGDPPRVAVDSAGNVYFGSLHSLFKIDRRGSLLRIAGTGRAGLTGDGGPAMAAQLNSPVGIAVDSAGAVYYTERDANLIRRVGSRRQYLDAARRRTERPDGPRVRFRGQPVRRRHRRECRPKNCGRTGR